MSVFDTLGEIISCKNTALLELFEQDLYPEKISLLSTTIRNEKNGLWTSPHVRAVESQIIKEYLNRDYLLTEGLQIFCQKAMEMLLGNNNYIITSKKACGLQTVGGTGALYLSCQFLSNYMNRKTILVAISPLDDHLEIAKLAHFQTIKQYRYLDQKNHQVDFDGMMEDIKDANFGAIIVLQICAHHQNESHPTKKKWIELFKVLKAMRIFIIFDIPAQGLASGDVDKDAWLVRYCVDQGLELFVCQSFSVNFGLYNERVGHLCVITNDPLYTENVKSQLLRIISKSWLNPPFHGAKVVGTILNDPILCLKWKENIKSVVNRATLIRKELYEKLISLETPGSWTHLINQKGIFSYIGLEKHHVVTLLKRHHIYLMTDGQVNISCINHSNVEYLAKSIDATIRENN